MSGPRKELVELATKAPQGVVWRVPKAGVAREVPEDRFGVGVRDVTVAVLPGVVPTRSLTHIGIRVRIMISSF